MSIWDDPAIAMNGDYIKFDNPGDTVTGTIVDIGIQTFPDGRRAPRLTLRTETGDKVMTAGQVQLAKKLGELRPEKGDTIKVQFTSVEKLQGGKTMKNFEVAVKKGNPTAADDLF